MLHSKIICIEHKTAVTHEIMHIKKFKEKIQILTWLGGMCFPLRTSSKRVPKLYITPPCVFLPVDTHSKHTQKKKKCEAKLNL